MKVRDEVKTPDERRGKIAEFNQSYDGKGKIARVWVTDSRGLSYPRWYITRELKPA